MNLYRIHYQIRATGQILICLSVGDNENDSINDLVSLVGKIRILNIYSLSEVHRISGSIKKRIVDKMMMSRATFKKGGRPRKYDTEDE